MKKRPRPLGSTLEYLEDRSLPAVLGVPWADPGHLTLSFTPDGTPVPGGTATNSQTFGAAGTTAVWQREIVRAFQTWASVTNLNIGLVADGGQAIGTPGAVQGDARFGDIRIAAAPLSAAAVATSMPFNWTGTTFSGDVLFNRAASFTVGNRVGAFDLYSVALHEAGHVLGLDHSDVPGSIMGEMYEYHTGLGAADIAAIQALYGVRTPDANEGKSGNDTAKRATALQTTGLTGRVVADGDLTTAADVDYYTFSTGASVGLTTVTVRLQAAGLSLLTGKVTVTNAAGTVVASGVVTDPRANDLTLQFTNPAAGGTFTVKVESATEDAFSVGAYRLTVDKINLTVPVPAVSALLAPVLDGGTNDTLAGATDLTRLTPPADARFDATYRGAIETRSDVDTYKLVAPTTTGTTILNVLVWGTDGAPLDPTLQVTDTAGKVLPSQVVANDRGLFSLSVGGVIPGATYYVSVAARVPGGSSATGGYFLGADFNTFRFVAPTSVGVGVVAPGETVTDTLTVSTGRVFQIGLGGMALGGAGGVVTLTVLDASGNVVFTVDATTGQPMTTVVRYLPPGTYTFKYTTRGIGTTPPGSIGFGLYLLELSDDVGPYASTTTSSPTTTTSSPPPADSTGSTSSPSTQPISGGYTYSGSSGSKTSSTTYTF